MSLRTLTRPRPVAAASDADTTRSARAEVRNPLLVLPSAQSLIDAPEQVRWLLARCLANVHTECSARAQALWLAGQPHKAALFKATAVYAGHIRRLALQKAPRFVAAGSGMARGLRLIHSHADGSPGVGSRPASTRQRRLARNGLRGVNALEQLHQLPIGHRALLATILADLSAHARQCAHESWHKHKAPMAAYHLAVAGHARRLSLALGRGQRNGRGTAP